MRRNQRLWIYVAPWRAALGTSPKCGTTSLYEALRDSFPDAVHRDDITRKITFVDPDVIVALTPTQAEMVQYPKYWIVRHPWARFQSLWREKARDSGRIGQKNIEVAGKTPRDLFEFIQQWDNWHWTPQVELAGPIADTTYIKLDSLKYWWREYLGRQKPFPHSHASIGEEKWDSDLMRDVLDYYSIDLSLWERAT